MPSFFSVILICKRDTNVRCVNKIIYFRVFPRNRIFFKKHQSFIFWQNNLLLYTTIFINLDIYKNFEKTYVEKLHRVDDAILVEYIFIPDFPGSYVLELVTELLWNGLVFFFWNKIKERKQLFWWFLFQQKYCCVHIFHPSQNLFRSEIGSRGRTLKCRRILVGFRRRIHC